MHEVSLAMEVVRQALEAAANAGASRVTAVQVELGVLRGVDPDAMEMAFTAVAAGTAAEGARLDLREIPARALCRQCGTEYAVAIDHYVCPRCQAADPRLLAGNDVVLRSVECEVPEEECR
ncbi:MAG: hydrogenase maturation nickel metallochaperone HypA [Armatimonadota bacterium]|nr:hydrogenase maturation nickel metallochaperone HypA [Armatimonadota bacterium]